MNVRTHWLRAARSWSAAVLGGLLLALVAAAGCAADDHPIVERANGLEKQIICPVCPGETIAQSQVQIAKDMRKLVREKLEAGESDKQIRDYFVASYGDRILASPPTRGFALAVWVVPPVLMLVAAGGLGLVLREMRRRRAADAGDAAARDGELAPYLNAVDEELDAVQRRRTSGSDDARGREVSET